MIRLRPAFAFLVVGLAVASFLHLLPGYAGAQSGAPSVLRIGSWNIQFLGSRTPAQDAGDLAKYIDFAKVDLLAVQEITPNGPAPAGFADPFESSKALDQTCDKLNQLQPGSQWRHILFPAFFVHPVKGKEQWTGVIWNEKKVQSSGQPIRLGVSNDRFPAGDPKGDFLWKRNAHAMKFTAGVGKTDFLVIPVHMKSNLGGAERAHREEEAQQLLKKLPDLNAKTAFAGEQDIVILGDTNFLPDDPLGKELARDVLVSAGFRDLNAANVGTHLGGKRAPFDRFFVPKSQPEFKGSTQAVRDDFLTQQSLTEKEFVQRFSDHLMIVTELQVMQDDD